MMELNIRKDQWVKVKLLDVFIKKEENDKENARKTILDKLGLTDDEAKLLFG